MTTKTQISSSERLNPWRFFGMATSRRSYSSTTIVSRRISGSVNMSSTSTALVEKHQTTVPSGPPWNQIAHSSSSTTWSPDQVKD